MITKSISGTYAVPTNFSFVESAQGVIIEVDTSIESATITLPPSNTYPRVTVIDASDNAAENPITVLPYEGETIEGHDDTVINRNGDSIDFESGPAETVVTSDEIQPSGEQTFVATGTIIQADIESFDEDFEILAKPGDNKRYDVIELSLNFRPGDNTYSNYTLDTELFISYGSSPLQLASGLITESLDKSITVRNFEGVVLFNRPILIFSTGSVAGGTGEIDFHIKYKVRELSV